MYKNHLKYFWQLCPGFVKTGLICLFEITNSEY